MEKELILLAVSRKYGNYCVAGIDTTTGEWIRIVSCCREIENAVRPADMVCQDGTSARVLDIVRVSCQDQEAAFHQPENHALVPGRRWIKTGRATMADVLKIHQPEQHAVLFYNSDRRVSRTEIACIPAGRRFSLALIRPSQVMVVVSQWPDKPRPTVKVCFLYRGREYTYISMTDPETAGVFAAKQPGRYKFSDEAEVYFVLSLGEAFALDGFHYKLVASVLRH